MVEKKDGSLFSTPFQSGKEISSARRRFKNLARNRFRIENFFEKPGSLYFIPRWVDRVDPDVFLKVVNGFL
jgi:hypothetical protein